MNGIFYSRRLVLGMHEDFKHEMKFINTSVKNVHNTDIKSFHEYLMFNSGDNHEGDILNIIVIGEIHECETKGQAGRLLVFGAILEVKEENREMTNAKLREFAFMGRFSVKNQQRTFKGLRLDCNPKWIKTGII